MKRLLLAWAMLLIPPTVYAAGDPLNFADFFTKTRLAYSVDQHYSRSTVLYSAYKRFHTVDGVEYANLNVGYDTTNKHPVLGVGLRADNLDSMLWGGPWGRAHVTSAKMPAVEAGPYFSFWPTVKDGKVHLDFWYGLMAAIGFGE